MSYRRQGIDTHRWVHSIADKEDTYLFSRYITNRGYQIPPVLVIFENSSIMILNTILQNIQPPFFSVKRACAIIFFLFFCYNSFSQSPAFFLSFQHLNNEQGLSQNTVTAMVQDNQGFMWLGTKDGLNRYDGTSIKFFRHKDGDSTSILSNYIQCLFKSSNGTIWIGTKEGLCSYSYAANRFTYYLLKGIKNLKGTGGIKNVTAIQEDGHQRMWIGTKGGLLELNEAKNKFSYYAVNEATEIENFTSNRIIDMAADKQGNLWMATHKGLKFFNTSTHVFTIYDHKEGDANSPAEPHVMAIAIDSIGKVYTVLFGNKLDIFDPHNKSFLHCKFPVSTPALKRTPMIFKILLDKMGNCWLGSENSGLFLFDPVSLTSHAYYKIAGRSESLADNLLTCLYQDESGMIWVGTQNSGAERFSIQNQDFISYFRKYPSDVVTDEYNIRKVIKDSTGCYWAASDRGLIKFNPQKNIFINYTNNNTPFGINSDLTNDVLKDEQGYIWVGTHDGINKFDPRTNKFTHFTCKPSYARGFDLPGFNEKKKDFMAGTEVYSVTRLRNGKMAFGTNHGLNVYDEARKSFDHKFNNKNIARLPNNYYTLVFEDRSHHIWIATDSVIMIDSTYMLLKKYHLAASCFAQANDDEIWIGTSLGLCCLQERTNRMTWYKTENGLPGNAVKAIAFDKKGDLWISTWNGIAVMNRNTKNFRAYTVQDGLPGNEFNDNAAFVTQTGEILFGGTKGFTVIDPAIISSYSYLPKVQITSFNISNNNAGLQPNLYEMNGINLNYLQNSFSFEMAALSFNHAEKNMFAYKLEGFDKDWIQNGTRKFASYTNVPPGEYTLSVIASNYEGVWNKEGINIKIVITPPFWKTLWFRLIAGLLAALLLFILIKWREGNIKKMNDEKLKVQALTAEKYKSQLELEQISSYFSSSLSNMNNTDEVMWDVAKNLIGKLGFVDCMIYLWNADKTKMIQVSGYGPKGSPEQIIKRPFDILPGQGVIGYVIQNKEAVIIPDTSIDERYRMDEIFRLSEITVPVKYNDELLGIIDSEHHEKNFFTARHLQILTTIAALVANKIKSIESEQSLRQKKAELADINQQLAEVQLASLRSQMNPHFIFNALNSIKTFIIENDAANAEKYLGKFSKLIRFILDNTQSGIVVLAKEIQLLQLYMDLEQLRFSDRLKYEIIVDKGIDRENIHIPSMLVQPFAENAILHGILHKRAEGFVSISFILHKGWLEIIIEDNGVGREKAKEFKKQNHTAHQSIGMEITMKRLMALRKNENTPAGINIIDKKNEEGEATGTKVIVSVPIDV